MRANKIPISQIIINKINAKVDFTYPGMTNRYIVGTINLHKSKNPSIFYKDIYKDVFNTLDKMTFKSNDTIGGWNNKGIYFVDLGTSLNDLNKALKLGKKWNQIAIYDTIDKKEIFI